jgi:hypothetical protein
MIEGKKRQKQEKQPSYTQAAWYEQENQVNSNSRYMDPPKSPKKVVWAAPVQAAILITLSGSE